MIIGNLKTLIIELKFLDKIKQIHDHHEDKVSNCIKKVEIVIESTM